MSGSDRSPGADRIHALLLIAILPGLISLYWIAYFSSDWTLPKFAIHPGSSTAEGLTSVYLGFENAFPLPDAFVAVTSAIAGLYLLGRDAKAALFGIFSGGGLMFLALIDIYFNILQHFYTRKVLIGSSALDLEIAINIACFLGSVWSVWRLWGHPLRKM